MTALGDWLTVREAAKLTGYHLEYIRQLVREEKIVGQKWGLSWMVSRLSILAYLEAAKKSEDRRQGPKSQDTKR